jgi:hypothetical protein
LAFSVFFFSSVLGFACPVSEIGAILCGLRLSAGEDGLLFLRLAWLFGLGSGHVLGLWLQAGELLAAISNLDNAGKHCRITKCDWGEELGDRLLPAPMAGFGKCLASHLDHVPIATRRDSLCALRLWAAEGVKGQGRM